MVDVDPTWLRGSPLTVRHFRLHVSDQLFADSTLLTTIFSFVDAETLDLLCLSSSTRLVASPGFFDGLQSHSKLQQLHVRAPKPIKELSSRLKLQIPFMRPCRQLRLRHGLLAAGTHDNARLAQQALDNEPIRERLALARHFAFWWGFSSERYRPGSDADEFSQHVGVCS